MPELPEVETVVRQLQPDLAGRCVRGVQVGWKRTLGGMTAAAFRRRVVGAEFAALHRRGKYIVFELVRQEASAGALVGHLRMSGRFAIRRSSAPAPGHTRLSLDLDGHDTLDFSDVRKFGRVEWVSDAAERLSALGVEPLSEDFSDQWFYDALRSRRRQLKPLLLDQHFIAGLGNIYVDEALHRARLHPQRSSAGLTRPVVRGLHGAIREVLEEAIAMNGSSFDSFYRTPEGRPGSFQNRFRVYGRAGDPCGRCGARVRRIVVGQRGTHLCTRCQRPPRVR